MKFKANTGDYLLLDSGDGRKLERFGKFVFSRPCAAAVWKPSLPAARWEQADAVFDRDGGNSWQFNTEIPASWNITVAGITFKLSTTDFGHVGLFPEQAGTWDWLGSALRARNSRPLSALNLFAYTGGATLAAAKSGAKVCHLDASRGMTQRARENADINGLTDAPIRWIVDDVVKFMDREIRRGNTYDAIILDPPSFGRGKSKEVFKIERDVMGLIDKCRKLLSQNARFLFLSCHTPAFTPSVLENILAQALPQRGTSISAGELYLSGKPPTLSVPSGTYALWQANGAGRQ